MKKMCISAVSALLLGNSLLLPVTTFAETTETIASSSEENVSSVSEERFQKLHRQKSKIQQPVVRRFPNQKS